MLMYSDMGAIPIDSTIRKNRRTKYSVTFIFINKQATWNYSHHKHTEKNYSFSQSITIFLLLKDPSVPFLYVEYIMLKLCFFNMFVISSRL